jgi:hypothetical protein
MRGRVLFPRLCLARHASVGTHPSGKTPRDQAGTYRAPTQQDHLSFQLFLRLWRPFEPGHAIRQHDVEQVEHPVCGDTLHTIAADVALDGLKDRRQGCSGTVWFSRPARSSSVQATGRAPGYVAYGHEAYRQVVLAEQVCDGDRIQRRVECVGDAAFEARDRPPV